MFIEYIKDKLVLNIHRVYKITCFEFSYSMYNDKLVLDVHMVYKTICLFWMFIWYLKGFTCSGCSCGI